MFRLGLVEEVSSRTGRPKVGRHSAEGFHVCVGVESRMMISRAGCVPQVGVKLDEVVAAVCQE